MTRNKPLLVAGIGNFLEFYDLGLYGFLAPVMAPLFFPSVNSTVTLMLSMSVFGSGFLARPLGAIFFGHIGDKKGRRIALSFSILLMALSTFLIGSLPTYDQIGIFSPILLTILRIMQGLCTGGEYNGAAIFIIECNDFRKAGLLSSLLIAFAITGIFLSSIVSSFVLLSCDPEICWRIPFLAGGIIGYIGFYIRRKLQEPESFSLQAEYYPSNIPIINVFKQNRNSILCSIGIGALTGALNLTLIGYLASYLKEYSSLNVLDITNILNICLLSYVFVLPLSGWVSDKIGHYKVLLLSSYTNFFLSIFEFQLISSNNYFLIMCGCFVLTIITGLYTGPIHAFMHGMFPNKQRYSGISFGFSLGLGVFGGLAPTISTILINYTKIREIPAFYFMILSIFSISAIKYGIKIINNCDEKSLKLTCLN